MKRAVRSSAVAVALAGAVLAPTAGHASVIYDSTPCTTKLVIAHEGYTADADGDTVESQIAAYDIGANVADTDIWKTKDNYFVEMHDNDVSHSTNGTGLVTDMTLAQIEELRTTGHDEQIPQVSDSLALTQFAEPGRYLQFETKWSLQGDWALKLVDDEIKAADMSSHVIIYSAYINQLQYLSTIDPDLTLWSKAGKPPRVNDLIGLDGVMLNAGDVTRKTVQMYHDAGYTVTRSRVANETDPHWLRFVKTGADALMTDDPLDTVARCKALPTEPTPSR